MTPGKQKTDFDLAAQCEALSALSPLPMLAVDGPGFVVQGANPAFCRLLGKPKEEVVGQAFSRNLTAGPNVISLAVVSLLNRVYATGEPGSCAGGEKQTDGSPAWSYTMWPVRSADGQISGILIQVMETTAFQRQPTFLHQVNQALMLGAVRQHELIENAENLNNRLQTEIVERKNAEQRLVSANDGLSQFAFAASHDLQEPLRMIAIYSQLLFKGYRGKLDDEAAMYIDHITNGTNRMRDLLTDLLNYSEAGASGREKDENVNLNALRERVEQTLRAAIDESGAVVTSDELPTLRGSATEFVQVFQNLIGNAIKYRDGRPPCIHVSAQLRDQEWCFNVKDNGMGIDPQYHEKIFGVFKRLHGKSIPGSGIGLAICKRVVERWGGRIWVESELGQGATFCFTYPDPISYT